jgi:hypothetical protein
MDSNESSCEIVDCEICGNNYEVSSISKDVTWLNNWLDIDITCSKCDKNGCNNCLITCFTCANECKSPPTICKVCNSKESDILIQIECEYHEEWNCSNHDAHCNECFGNKNYHDKMQ